MSSEVLFLTLTQRGGKSFARGMPAAGPTAGALLNITAPALVIHETPAMLCARRPPFGFLADPGTLAGITAGLRRDHNQSRSSSAGRAAPGTQRAACLEVARLFKRLAASAHRTVTAASLRHRSCAVVGSSGSMLGAGRGAAIDAHDAVFRFNLAPTASQWAPDVGSRTTYRLFNGQSRFRTRMIDGGKQIDGAGGSVQHVLYCPFDRRLSKCLLAGVPWPTGKPAFAQPWLLANPALVAEVGAHQMGQGGRGVRMISTGLLGTAMAARLCGSVTLYGFGNGSDTSGAGVCGHYWECSHNNSKYRNQSKYFRGKGGYHDWQAHWRVLQHWVDRGAIDFVA